MPRPKKVLRYECLNDAEFVQNESTLEEWRTAIDKLIVKYGKEAKLEYEYGSGWHDWSINWKRFETQDEVKQRLVQEQAAARHKIALEAATQQNERKLLATLAEKYKYDLKNKD